MADNECPHCGMPPGECYRICPSQDPYGGDQAREEEDYSFNARYDDVRERYASTALDAAAFDDGDDWCDDDREADPTVMPATMQRSVIDNPNLMGRKPAPAEDDIPF